MESKKSSKADLERQRSTFFQVGLIVSLVILLMAFECSRPTSDLKILTGRASFEPEDDFKIITRRKEKPEVKIIKPKDVIEIIFNEDKEPKDILEINSEADENTGIEKIELKDEEAVEENIPYVVVQEQAEFPGGYSALNRFMIDNIEYPEMASEINLTGTVYLRFIVLKNGKIGKVEIMRSVDPLLDNEAIRVIKLMPAWKPGKNAGKPVNCWFVMPIKFELQ